MHFTKRRVTLVGGFFALLFAVGLSSLIFSSKVYALAETLSWTTPTTITVSNGQELGAPVILTANGTEKCGRNGVCTTNFSGSGTWAKYPNCTIDISLNVQTKPLPTAATSKGDIDLELQASTRGGDPNCNTKLKEFTGTGTRGIQETVPIANVAIFTAPQTCAGQGGTYDAATQKCTLPTCPAVPGGINGDVSGEYVVAQKKCAYLASQFPGGKCPTGLTAGTYTSPTALNSTPQPACLGAATAGAGNSIGPDPCPISPDAKIRWLMCPVFELANTFTVALDGFINDYLGVGNDILNDNGGGYHAAWATMRTFGIALVVIAGLFMIISEALGLQILDAYTVRKVAPRLLIGVIGIAVSWSLMTFVIGAFDDLGHAMANIIYSAFATGGAANAKDTSITTILGLAVAQGAAVTGIFVKLSLLGPAGILSAIGTLLFAMLIGIVVLIARQAIIVACVLLAPLAIAAYILPNTSKLAKFWWSTFISMLVLYPIATGLIALCKVMGNITIGLGKPLSVFAGIIFFFIGYALLPFAFRFAGGTAATLGGIYNDRTKGVFDKGKKKRADIQGERFNRAKSGNLYRGNNAVTDRINRVTGGAGAFANSSDKLGFLSRGERGRTAREEAFSNHRAQVNAEFGESAQGKIGRFKDDVRRAQTFRTQQEAEQNLAQQYYYEYDAAGNVTNQAAADQRAQRSIQAARSNGGFSSAVSVAALKQLSASGTGFENNTQLAQALGRVADGNQSLLNDMVGDIRGSSKGAGRHDLGGGSHAAIVALANSTNNGANAPSAADVRSLLVDAARNTDNATLVRGKPVGTRAMTDALTTTMQNDLTTIQAAGDSDENAPVREAARARTAVIAAKINNISQSAMYGPEVTSEAMNDGTVGRQAAPNGFVGANAPAIQNTIEIVQQQAAAQVPLTAINQTTGREEIVVEPVNNTIVTVPNPLHRPGAENYARDANRAQYNPNDPRQQP